MPITEDLPLAPTNVYGETKLAFERMLRWLEQIHGLRWIALRYFNAAGATERLGEDHDPESHLIPNVLQVPLGRREHVPAVRHGLPHAGRHLHPGLRARGRPGRRAHPGPRGAGSGGAGRRRAGPSTWARRTTWERYGSTAR